ncbi:MAG TPA: hypothetical protein VHR47_07865, partial [Bacillota bacterium]|nr:hypothetical protein [Bacillota bacterium]
MKRLFGLMMVCLILINGGGLYADRPENGFKLPPVVKAARSYPRLVNYCHMIYLTENNVANREEYLAQWDVLILYPEAVTKQGLSLRKIRQVNPTIKILAWIPFGQSSEEFAMSQALPNLTDYYIRDAHGRSVSPPWGGHLMNPWK